MRKNECNMDEIIWMADVPAAVLRLTGQKISRQTAYNWTKKGRHGAKLVTGLSDLGQYFVQEGNLVGFLNQLRGVK